MTPNDFAAQCFKEACLAELAALKPGNVHALADGHGMVVEDFVKSAHAASLVIAAQGLSVGQRIFQAVDATWQAVGCNTNLGIVLLAAPLIEAYQESPNDWVKQLPKVLDNLTIADAKQAYAAIRMASPAGLGKHEQHDVAAEPTITLKQAMIEAKEDMVAMQYAEHYHLIFNEGLPLYMQLLEKWERPAWAATGLYLYFLSHYEDTHIKRKWGKKIAEQILDQAKSHYVVYTELENPKTYLRPLLVFDSELKTRQINPGTSADLTVATLLTYVLNDGNIAAR